MTGYLFHGGRFLDPRQGELQDGIEVLIEGDRVKEVADRPIRSEAATRVDLRGRTLRSSARRRSSTPRSCSARASSASWCPAPMPTFSSSTATPRAISASSRTRARISPPS
jgi:hypothetical protein